VVEMKKNLIQIISLFFLASLVRVKAAGLNCVSYEPFSDSNYPSNVQQALKNTLSAVVSQGFKCIKTYYSQYYGIKIAEIAQQHNLKVVLGIRMGESFTENEIQAAISSCKSNARSAILGIYAGNENPHATNDIVNIKNRVKASGCNLPFGTVQTLGDFLNNQNVIRIVDQMDWLGYNVYPFFSNLGGQSSQVSLRNQINQIKAKYGGRFGKFRIAETGWPSAGGNSQAGNPSTMARAKEYADFFASMLCSGEINTPWVSYFTFFDPTYKRNVPSFENNFGLVKFQNGYKPKWNIKNLHC
jgi:exo-beta-1,3-glucanase (GH17 family)